MIGTGHVPVLLEEALGQLDSGRAGTYIDGTLGLGGHSLEILKRNPKASIIGFDRDEASLREAAKRLEGYSDRVRLYHGDFKEIPGLELDLRKVRGVLLDLGISSFQLDQPERGFSFNADGPLDMRMDRRAKTTAAAILEKYSEARLDEVFREYGELPQTRRLAREIVTRRKLHPFETTGRAPPARRGDLPVAPAERQAPPGRQGLPGPAHRDQRRARGSRRFLESMAAGTRPGTRLVVIAFHSLEDRIVKRTFAALASPAERTPLLEGPDEEADHGVRRRDHREFPVALGQAEGGGEDLNGPPEIRPQGDRPGGGIHPAPPRHPDVLHLVPDRGRPARLPDRRARGPDRPGEGGHQEAGGEEGRAPVPPPDRGDRPRRAWGSSTPPRARSSTKDGTSSRRRSFRESPFANGMRPRALAVAVVLAAWFVLDPRAARPAPGLRARPAQGRRPRAEPERDRRLSQAGDDLPTGTGRSSPEASRSNPVYFSPVREPSRRPAKWSRS